MPKTVATSEQRKPTETPIKLRKKNNEELKKRKLLLRSLQISRFLLFEFIFIKSSENFSPNQQPK
jgi:hypothetical protein